jgi:N utilization substance protein B
VLHEADVRGEDPAAVLARWDEVEAPAARAREGRVDADPDLGPVVADVFARGLIAGVAARRDELDARIGKVSHAWRVERMPVVDRNVLRLAVHELLHESTPVAVVLDEAVRLVGELSTDASGRFVNGVLAAILRDLGRAPDPAGD